mmetsp:Transcript_109223/g.308055  ORF Transcript_109223/g.308055 Transcript_109223/m.308055 type:complete len:397 (+) Transcript_109223:261-1451(+)
MPDMGDEPTDELSPRELCPRPAAGFCASAPHCKTSVVPRSPPALAAVVGMRTTSGEAKVERALKASAVWGTMRCASPPEAPLKAQAACHTELSKALASVFAASAGALRTTPSARRRRNTRPPCVPINSSPSFTKASEIRCWVRAGTAGTATSPIGVHAPSSSMYRTTSSGARSWSNAACKRRSPPTPPGPRIHPATAATKRVPSASGKDGGALARAPQAQRPPALGRVPGHAERWPARDTSNKPSLSSPNSAPTQLAPTRGGCSASPVRRNSSATVCDALAPPRPTEAAAPKPRGEIAATTRVAEEDVVLEAHASNFGPKSAGHVMRSFRTSVALFAGRLSAPSSTAASAVASALLWALPIMLAAAPTTCGGSAAKRLRNASCEVAAVAFGSTAVP